MRKLLLLAALCTAFAANSADFAPLTFEMADGTKIAFASDNLEMAFSDGNLLGWTRANNSRSETVSGTLFNFPISNLAKFYFGTSLEDGVVNITAAESQEVTVYDITGNRLGTFENLDCAKMSLSKGFYLIQSRNSSFKTVIK